MIENENPFMIRGINTKKQDMDSAMINTLMAITKDPTKAEKYQIKLLDLGSVVVGIMPIIDSLYPEAALVVRIFAMNFGKGTALKYTLSAAPFSEAYVPELKGSLPFLTENDRTYFDLLIVIVPGNSNDLHLALGPIEQALRNFETTGAISRWWDEIHIPVTRIGKKPENAEEIEKTNLLGVTAKEYISQQSAKKVLRDYFIELDSLENYANIAVLICCCCFGVGIFYLPFFLIKRRKTKKKLIAYLERLGLTV